MAVKSVPPSASTKVFTDLMFGRPIYGAPAPLPCPFCGGDPAIDHAIEATQQNSDVFVPECTDCGSEGPGAASQIEAAMTWNTRQSERLAAA
jgi:Lar family restriction alleviation protein